MITAAVAAVVWVLFAHWIADFIVQTRWMGNNKSTNQKAMLSHIATYSFTLLILLAPLATTAWLLMGFVLINGVAHYATDSVSSKVTKWCWNNGHDHWFWAAIGLDQFCHVAVLVLTLGLLK